jgi:hypothetical protein
LLLLMVLCHEDQRTALQRAQGFIRSGLSAFFNNPHTSLTLKMGALTFALMPQALLIKMMTTNKRLLQKLS